MHTPQAQGGARPEYVESGQIVRIGSQREPEQRNFERDVLAGLSRAPKTVPSMHLYDARGSQLFQRIMDLPEYYVTRAEREVLERHGAELTLAVRDGRQPVDVVDLGAGDGLKSRILLERFARSEGAVRYLPIDISEHALETVIAACRRELPWLATQGVVADYAEGIAWLSRRDPSRRRLVLVLGSNIGNLTHGAALRFFRSLRRALRPGDQVLVGFDLVKDPARLQRAYDDPAGVTAEFNLNLLRRINRELGGDFDLRAFRHVASFAPIRRAMESFLVSTRAQRVHVAGQHFEFEAWEPMRTEISCKYRLSDVSAFARRAGFAELGQYHDERRFFVDALWSVEPEGSAPRQ